MFCLQGCSPTHPHPEPPIRWELTIETGRPPGAFILAAGKLPMFLSVLTLQGIGSLQENYSSALFLVVVIPVASSALKNSQKHKQ